MKEYQHLILLLTCVVKLSDAHFPITSDNFPRKTIPLHWEGNVKESNPELRQYVIHSNTWEGNVKEKRGKMQILKKLGKTMFSIPVVGQPKGY